MVLLQDWSSAGFKQVTVHQAVLYFSALTLAADIFGGLGRLTSGCAQAQLALGVRIQLDTTLVNLSKSYFTNGGTFADVISFVEFDYEALAVLGELPCISTILAFQMFALVYKFPQLTIIIFIAMVLRTYQVTFNKSSAALTHEPVQADPDISLVLPL